MAPSTALCFSLIAVGLILQLTRPALRWPACLLAAIVFAIVCAKLAEFVAGINSGINSWLVRNPGTFGAVPTGRMSPITAANFSLPRQDYSRWRRDICEDGPGFSAHWRPLTAALCAVAFAALIVWIISGLSMAIGGRIDRAEQARNLAQAQLVALNAELETRVQERTRELRAKNQQMAEELRMARELQLALLPQEFPTVPADVPDHESALRFLSLYFPTGDVSGDFFSVFPVGEKAAGVFICDVMGHGVRSALITSMIRALMEEQAQVIGDPGELLTRVNHALAEILKQARTTMFATCFYLVADVNTAELRFANAGHPCALHIRQRSAPAEKLQSDGRVGPAMGILPSARYETATRSMAKGDLIMLFTDGLFEVEDREGNVFSQQQLHATINRHAALPPEEFFSRVLEEIRKSSKRDAFDDDVCVVGVEVRRTD